MNMLGLLIEAESGPGRGEYLYSYVVICLLFLNRESTLPHKKV